jgi:polyferredoxin
MPVSRWRWLVLTLSFVLLTFGGLAGVHLGSYLPTFACYFVGSDTYGGACFLATLQMALAEGNLAGLFAALTILVVAVLLIIPLGGAWCGWICPFAFIQDVLDVLRRKLGIGYVRFPETLRRNLRPLRWIFLVILFVLPLWAAFPLLVPAVARHLGIPFCELCPVRYIMPLFTERAGYMGVSFGSITTFVLSALGVLFAGFTLVGAFFKRRFWCAYCPMVLLLSFFRRISLPKLKKDVTRCTRCEICYNVCPMDIEQVFLERQREDVTFPDCVLCMECVEHCPENDALRLTYGGITLLRSSRAAFSRRRGIDDSQDGPREENHE